LSPAAASRGNRTPFVLLIVGLLGLGLLVLLLLNTALNQGSFEQSKVQKKVDSLTDEQQDLRRRIDDKSAPGELARQARELGMVPGGNPVFIDPATGQVLGSPKPVAAPSTPPPAPAPSPSR
jgi:cell division protein FtsB